MKKIEFTLFYSQNQLAVTLSSQKTASNEKHLDPP